MHVHVFDVLAPGVVVSHGSIVRVWVRLENFLSAAKFRKLFLIITKYTVYDVQTFENSYLQIPLFYLSSWTQHKNSRFLFRCP